jgi:uncharacterized membrane protein
MRDEEFAMTRAELKQKAKTQLNGNWGWAAILTLLMIVINAVLTNLIKRASTGRGWVDDYYRFFNVDYWTVTGGHPLLFDLLSIIALVFSGLLTWGLYFSLLKLADTGEKDSVGQSLFAAMNSHTFKNSVLTCFLTQLFTALWSILLVVPGIIKSYSYSQAAFIMKDMFDSGHQMTATEAITASRQVMDGHKAELFLLDLSFIGWFLLGAITLGIGYIWITPYYTETRANYYRQLVGNRFLAD